MPQITLTDVYTSLIANTSVLWSITNTSISLVALKNMEIIRFRNERASHARWIVHMLPLGHQTPVLFSTS